MKWLFLAVLLVVVGAATAFGTYTWGSRDKGRTDAQEQALAEDDIRAIAAACLGGPCRVKEFHRAAPAVWEVTLTSYGREHCGTVRLDPNADGFTFSETGCS